MNVGSSLIKLFGSGCNLFALWLRRRSAMEMIFRREKEIGKGPVKPIKLEMFRSNFSVKEAIVYFSCSRFAMDMSPKFGRWFLSEESTNEICFGY